mgnify:CR=1 FL=1|tara:strand:- start:426 stop:701 length:276 start_codon:yes stop_codon:yes gene_type:complete
MKVKKIASGFYNIFHNGHKFECENIQTDFGWEWALALVEINKCLIREYDKSNSNDYKVVVSETETFETTEWVTTLDTLRECKEVVLKNFSA